MAALLESALAVIQFALAKTVPRTWQEIDRPAARTTAASARQSGLRVPDLPAAKAENMAICTASSAKQCRSNPVSGRRLPKTGIFQMSAGDYRLFWSENAANRNLETGV